MFSLLRHFDTEKTSLFVRRCTACEEHQYLTSKRTTSVQELLLRAAAQIYAEQLYQYCVEYRAEFPTIRTALFQS